MKVLYLNLIFSSITVFAILVGGCTDTDAVKLEAATIGNTRNVHKHEGFYLAGQPSKADLEEAQKIGVNTVFNLRMPSEQPFDEKPVVKELGMSYHNVGIDSADSLTDPVLDEIRRMLRLINLLDENKPILLHCGTGNRVGAVWLAYRALEDDIDYDTALAEAKTVGLRDQLMEEVVEDYIKRNQQ